jgi:hypothetical protein
VSPVKYELGFYVPEDDILHSHRREYFKSYTGCSCGYNIKRNFTADGLIWNAFIWLRIKTGGRLLCTW